MLFFQLCVYLSFIANIECIIIFLMSIAVSSLLVCTSIKHVNPLTNSNTFRAICTEVINRTITTDHEIDTHTAIKPHDENLTPCVTGILFFPILSIVKLFSHLFTVCHKPIASCHV